MRFQILRLLFCSCLFLPRISWGGLLIDFDYGIAQDSIVTSSTVSSQKTLMNMGGFVNVDTKETFYLGAGVISLGASDVSTATTGYSTQDMYLSAKYNIDKNKIFSITGGYAMTANGTYTSGSSTETWIGTSMMFKFQACQQFKKLGLGAAIIYYSGTYTTRTVSNATSTVNYSKTFMVPAISAYYRF